MKLPWLPIYLAKKQYFTNLNSLGTEHFPYLTTKFGVKTRVFGRYHLIRFLLSPGRCKDRTVYVDHLEELLQIDLRMSKVSRKENMPRNTRH